MKLTYFFALLVIIGLGILFEFQVFFTEIAKSSLLDKALQGAGVFVALFTAFIALAMSDRKSKRIKTKVTISADKATKSETFKNQMTGAIKDIYKDFPDPVVSYQVHFLIKNRSGFDLKKPTMSFTLPLNRQHPAKSNSSDKHDSRFFNSNLFNSPRDLMIFEFADTRILSNSNLPFWNNKDELTFWIRMVLENNSSESFNMKFSINSENADGVTEKVSIDPLKVLKD